MCDSANTSTNNTHLLIDISSDDDIDEHINEIQLISMSPSIPSMDTCNSNEQTVNASKHGLNTYYSECSFEHISDNSDINDLINKYIQTFWRRVEKKNKNMKDCLQSFVCNFVDLLKQIQSQSSNSSHYNYNLIKSAQFNELLCEALISISADSAPNLDRIFENHLENYNKFEKIMNDKSNDSETKYESIYDCNIKKEKQIDGEDEYYGADSPINFKVSDNSEQSNDSYIDTELTPNCSETIASISHAINDINNNEDYAQLMGESSIDKNLKMEKLWKTYNELNEKIRELDNHPISLQHLDNNNIALFSDNLVHQLIKVWEEMCEIDGSLPVSERKVDELFNFEQFIENVDIRSKLESEMNSLMLVNGFPDLITIVEIVSSVIKEKNLSNEHEFSSDEEIANYCGKVLEKVGREIIDRRKRDRTEFIHQYINEQQNWDQIELPENTDTILKEKLEANRKNAKTLDEVFDRYVMIEKQNNKRKHKCEIIETETETNVNNINTINNIVCDNSSSIKKIKRITPITVETN